MEEDDGLSTAESPDAALSASDVHATTLQALNDLTLIASSYPIFLNSKPLLSNCGLKQLQGVFNWALKQSQFNTETIGKKIGKFYSYS